MARLDPIQRAEAVANAIHAVHLRRAEDWRRPHLGASLIGHQCDRHLWLTFRWALAPQHDGKQLRLFARGHREEAWVIDDLRAAGLTVHDVDPATGEQWMVSWGHFGGHLDGIVRGVPGLPADEAAVLECKTHNKKSFERLLDKGLRSAKPEHWAQAQVYMLGEGLRWTLYIAVCKDDDRIEALLVPFDEGAARAFVDRGVDICASAAVPPKMPDRDYPPCVYTSADGTRWPCQHYDLCHGAAVPAKNCRTCVSVFGMETKRFRCACDEVEADVLGIADERAGCPSHLTIPELHNAQVVEVDDGARRIVYQRPDGTVFVDGGGGVA